MDFYTSLIHYCKYLERYLNNKSDFTKKSYNSILSHSSEPTKDACKVLTQELHQSKNVNLTFNLDNFHFEFVLLFEHFYVTILNQDDEFYSKENIRIVFKILKIALQNDSFCVNNVKFSDEQNSKLSHICRKMTEVFNENGKQEWITDLSQNNNQEQTILSDKEKAVIDYMFSKFEFMNKQSSQALSQTNSNDVVLLSQESSGSNNNSEKNKPKNRNVSFKTNYPENATDRSNLNKIKTLFDKMLRYENHIKVLNEHVKAGSAPSVLNVKFPPPMLPHDPKSIDFYKKEIQKFQVSTMKMYIDRLEELIDDYKTNIAVIKEENLKHLTDLNDIVDSMYADLENSLKPKFISSLEKANRIINRNKNLPFHSNNNLYSNSNESLQDTIDSLNFETESNPRNTNAYVYSEQQKTNGSVSDVNAFQSQHFLHENNYRNSTNNNFMNKQFFNNDSNFFNSACTIQNSNHRSSQQNQPYQPNFHHNNYSQMRNNSINNSRNNSRNNSWRHKGTTKRNNSSNSFRYNRSNSRQSTNREQFINQNQQNTNYRVNHTSTPRTNRMNDGNNNFNSTRHNYRYDENFQRQRKDHRPRPRN